MVKEKANSNEDEILQSTIRQAERREKEQSRVDLPQRIIEAEQRIRRRPLPKGTQLSSGGMGRWKSIQETCDLKLNGIYWLPSKGSSLHRKNLLFDARQRLLADPYGLPDTDLQILVLNLLDPAIDWLDRKIEKEKADQNPDSDFSDPIP